MAKIDEILLLAREYEATDIYMTAGMPLQYRVNGKLLRAPIQPSEKEVEDTIYEILNQKKKKAFDDGEDVSLSFKNQDGIRQRIHVFRQRKRMAAVIHLLCSKIPSLEDKENFSQLNLLLEEPEGLILIAGKPGSGRTTMAVSMLEYLNTSSNRHILTLENPVEYIFQGKKCLIHQREIGRDVATMAQALKSAMYEACDVVYVTEIPDFECLQALMRLIEAGNLVIAVVDVAEAKRVQKSLVNLCPEEYRSIMDSRLEEYVKGIIQMKRIDSSEEGESKIQSEVLFEQFREIDF